MTKRPQDIMFRFLLPASESLVDLGKMANFLALLPYLVANFLNRMKPVKTGAGHLSKKSP